MKQRRIFSHLFSSHFVVSCPVLSSPLIFMSDRDRDRRGNHRVYVGNLSSAVRVRDLEDLFYRYYPANVSVKEGFGFIDFDHSRDADDAIHYMDGTNVEGKRISVQLARPSKFGAGGRDKENFRDKPRFSKSVAGKGFRVDVENISNTTTWQSLKDFAREGGKVLFADVRFENGKKIGIIEYETESDVKKALSKLDDSKLDGNYVRLYADSGKKSPSRSRSRGRSKSPRRSKSHSRSRSPRRNSRSASPINRNDLNPEIREQRQEETSNNNNGSNANENQNNETIPENNTTESTEPPTDTSNNNADAPESNQ
jgi:arginine/serine-rich splicing factor 4/5/6